jgi:hypothetical protein
MAEYQDLPELVRTADPDRIVLAWIDKPIAVPTQLAGKTESVPSDEAQRLAHSFLGEGYGLPFSVMLDKHERRCAIWRAPLHARDIAAMRKQCIA